MTHDWALYLNRMHNFDCIFIYDLYIVGRIRNLRLTLDWAYSCSTKRHFRVNLPSSWKEIPPQLYHVFMYCIFTVGIRRANLSSIVYKLCKHHLTLYGFSDDSMGRDYRSLHRVGNANVLNAKLYHSLVGVNILGVWKKRSPQRRYLTTKVKRMVLPSQIHCCTSSSCNTRDSCWFVIKETVFSVILWNSLVIIKCL